MRSCLRAGIFLVLLSARAPAAGDEAPELRKICTQLGQTDLLQFDFDLKLPVEHQSPTLELQAGSDPRSLRVLPRRIGGDQFEVRDSSNRLRFRYRVHVVSAEVFRDLSTIRSLLRELPGVRVDAMGEQVLIEGEARGHDELERIFRVQAAFYDRVVNLIANPPGFCERYSCRAASGGRMMPARDEAAAPAGSAEDPVVAAVRRATEDAVWFRRLPEEAKRVMLRYQIDRGELEKGEAKKMDKLDRRVAARMSGLRDRYRREGKEAESQAIRWQLLERFQWIEGADWRAPGRVDVGQRYRVELTGSREGKVWGSGEYLAESRLEAAAVHAGVLRAGEKGLVEVDITAGRGSYEGSRRHGVVSETYREGKASLRLRKPAR